MTLEEDERLLSSLQGGIEALEQRAATRKCFNLKVDMERRRWQQLFDIQLAIDLKEERAWSNMKASERDREEMLFIFSEMEAGRGNAVTYRKMASKSTAAAQREKEESVTAQRAALDDLRKQACSLSKVRHASALEKRCSHEREFKLLEKRRWDIRNIYHRQNVSTLTKDEGSQRARLVREELDEVNVLWLDIRRAEIAVKNSIGGAKERQRTAKRLEQITNFQVDAFKWEMNKFVFRRNLQRDQLQKARKYYIGLAEQCADLVAECDAAQPVELPK